MSDLKLIGYFKKQVLRFVDEVIEQFPDKPDFLLVKLIVTDKIPLHDMMGRFMQQVLPDKDRIVNRDLFFFKSDFVKGYENWPNLNRIFTEVKDLYFSERLDDDERETIWKWVELFMRICEKYYIQFGEIEGWELKEEDLDNDCIKAMIAKRQEFLKTH